MRGFSIFRSAILVTRLGNEALMLIRKNCKQRCASMPPGQNLRFLCQYYLNTKKLRPNLYTKLRNISSCNTTKTVIVLLFGRLLNWET